MEKDSFQLEKDIQQLVEANLETLFGLQLVSSEFSVGGFRIDTLAYDEPANSFVIIEYKRGSSYSVVDQGYSYLSVMVNNKAEFILEYNERMEQSLKRAEVDWASSKVLFIAPSFNAYQCNSINFSDVPFELWEIRKFENGLLALEQLESTSSESIEKLASKDSKSVISKVNSEVKTLTIEEHVQMLDKEFREIWDGLQERLQQLEGGTFYSTNSYVSFKRDGTSVCVMKYRKKEIQIELLRGNTKPEGVKSKEFFTLDDPKQIAKKRSWKWKSGVRGNKYLIPLKKLEQLDYVMFLIDQKFKALG
ncbi:MAG: hypothetical protein CMI30_08515 [Opitutae bacterium]|nr:hypothetical protein [Opitutae bacterium]